MEVREEIRSQAGSWTTQILAIAGSSYKPAPASLWYRVEWRSTRDGSKRSKNAYLGEWSWRVHEILCLQHLELCLANMCPINTTTVIITVSSICRVMSFCEYIGCQEVISGITSSYLGSAMVRLLVISAFSASGQAEVFHVLPLISYSPLPCAELR